MTHCEVFCVGYIRNNCILVYNDDCQEAVIVDPAKNFNQIYERVNQLNKKVVAVLLTHGHWDHVFESQKWKDIGAKLYIHELDKSKLGRDFDDWRKNCGLPIVPLTADATFSDGDELKFGTIDIKVLHTPGHSAGSCCFIIGDTILSGDTLFANSYGRTDFYDGDFVELRHSIMKLFQLEGDFRVIPGHEGETSLDYERKNNPIGV